MSKQGGRLKKGRRLRSEVPSVSPASGLQPLQRAAQVALVELVEATGGRFGTRDPVGIGHVDVLADLFDDWAGGNAE